MRNVINYVTNNMDMFDDVCDCGFDDINDGIGVLAWPLHRFTLDNFEV